MALPKISSPIFDLKIPSTKKAVKFRPFLVKEEKILLMAQQSGDEKDITNAIMQIINNCVTSDEEFNVSRLATFDLEYIFLKIRAKSVNNIVELSYRDTEDNKLYDFKVNLDNIEITYNKKNNNKIQINDTAGIVMKFPEARISEKLGDLTGTAAEFKIIELCVDKIYDGDAVYRSEEMAPNELSEFIDNLDVKTFNKIKEFFDTMPKLYHKINYKNANGNDRSIELSSLKDFFTLG